MANPETPPDAVEEEAPSATAPGMSSDMLKFHISQLKFRDGTVLTLSDTSLCVLVGPNNVGKSATLGDIRQKLVSQNHQALVIDELKIEKTSTFGDLAHLLGQARRPDGYFEIAGHAADKGSIERWLNPAEPYLDAFLTNLAVSELSTRMRLGDCDVQGSIDNRTPFAATHPFQRMYTDHKLEEETSAAFREAFRQDFVLFRDGGSMLSAYIGERPELQPGEQPFHLSYTARLTKLAALETQGDGMRSFASVIGRVITERRPIQLIDEPEAFLHPPQARLVGRAIAQKSAKRQTFLATHSSEVLQGLLSIPGANVSVVRLTRTTAGGRAAELSNTEIKKLWSNPILRFSKILDGLFHEGVILTEADGDCRLYEALADASLAESARRDILYTYCGGKDRVPVVVTALRALGVPVLSVLDFDVLNAENPLRPIIESYGGSWTEFQADWRAVKAAVEANSAFLAGDAFKQKISDALKPVPAGGVVPKEIVAEIKRLARNASPWDHVKAGGLANIPPGEPTQAAERLLEKLRGIGIFVVPVGEMEGFYRKSGKHGPKFVAQVLTCDLAGDSDLASARKFVGDMFAFFT